MGFFFTLNFLVKKQMKLKKNKDICHVEPSCDNHGCSAVLEPLTCALLRCVGEPLPLQQTSAI